MSYFDGSFLDTTSYWDPPCSPNIGTILAMLNQADNGENPITEIFSQTNLSRNQSGQRPGLGERIAARTGFNIPTLERENISPFAELFTNSIVPSPIVAVSPGFSPTLFQTPNMFSNSLQIMPLMSPIINYEPQETVENFGDTTMMISNTELPHQPLQVNLSPPQEASASIATDESIEPLGASLIASFESQDVDEANINIISIEEDTKDEETNKEEDENDANEFTTLDDSDIVKSSSPKRRKFEVSSNMIGATRTNKVPRVIIHMEIQEKNPYDGYHWRKYGQKVVRGNPNPRSYYKCTFDGCNVKKHVEKGAGDVKFVVITYDGIHEHEPVRRGSSNSSSRTQSGSTMSLDHHSGGTTSSEKQPSSSYTTTSQEIRSPSLPYTTSSQEMRPLTMLGPPIDMTHLYLTGISKLPSLPLQQNSSFTYQNNERD